MSEILYNSMTEKLLPEREREREREREYDSFKMIADPY